jgi:nitroreductase/ketosteroid isomerase-like protein
MRVPTFVPLALLAVTAAQGWGQPPQGHRDLSLRETFQAYVEAVHAGTAEEFIAPVAGGPNAFFMASSGEMVEGAPAADRFRAAWSTGSGADAIELIRIDEGRDMGFTLARLRYGRADGNGTTHYLDACVTLVWRRFNGAWKIVGDVSSPMGGYYTSASGQRLYSDAQHDALETLLNRRTVLRFRDVAVPDEHVRLVLTAAANAPTAGNQQPWKFLVVRDRSKLDTLRDRAVEAHMAKVREAGAPADTATFRQRLEAAVDGALSAPVYIAVLANRQARYPEHVDEEGSLAAGNLMNAARALGYGTGFFTSLFPDDVMRSLFNIPERYSIICFTPVGVPETWPEAPPKKPLETLVVREVFQGH